LVRNKAIFDSPGSEFTVRALNLAREFEFFSYFNPNNISYPFDPFPNFLGLGKTQVIESVENIFEKIENWHTKNSDWLIGYLGYDLKNQVEKLKSRNPDLIKAPDSIFYQPEHLIFWKEDKVEIHTPGDPETLFKLLQSCKESTGARTYLPDLEAGMSRSEYLDKVALIKEHIVEGDLYEVNLCLEFNTNHASIDPLSVYQQLNDISPMPFFLPFTASRTCSSCRPRPKGLSRKKAIS